jgi:hypothetical protein
MEEGDAQVLSCSILRLIHGVCLPPEIIGDWPLQGYLSMKSESKQRIHHRAPTNSS